MAKCDEGYLCDVCGRDVAEIADSELCTCAYVIGLADPKSCTAKERHVRSQSTLYVITDPAFDPPVVVRKEPFKAGPRPDDGPRARIWSRGAGRLPELAGSELRIIDYPLPEVRARLERGVDVTPVRTAASAVARCARPWGSGQAEAPAPTVIWRDILL